MGSCYLASKDLSMEELFRHSDTPDVECLVTKKNPQTLRSKLPGKCSTNGNLWAEEENAGAITGQDKFHREPFPKMGMSDNEFRNAAKDMVDYVIKYYSSMKGRQAFPSVKPGFLREMLPLEPPRRAEPWKDLFSDLDEVVMKGMTHWQSSRFFAYFPSGTSYPSILAEILCNACSCIGFTWASSPSCTELESIVLDWLAKAIGLPDCFIHNGEGPGGGIIQGSAGEAVLNTLLAARTKALKQLSVKHPNLSPYEIMEKLVVYTSKYTHFTVERACLIAMVQLHTLDVDDKISVRGETLKNAMEKDRSDGKIPFYVCASLGTTACTSFDNLNEIGEICSAENIWLHVDAAYAGCSFVCPEFRHRMSGIEMVTSFNINPQKWLMMNFDLSALWVRNSSDLINSFKINRVYVEHEAETCPKTIDYRHWEIPFGRRFRSLKVWFVMRLIGIDGLRHKIREDVKLAKLFESFVRKDSRFEVLFQVELGLVCFRLTRYRNANENSNKLNKLLLDRINDSRDIHLVAAEVEKVYFLRVSCGAVACDEDAMKNCWEVIQKHATALLDELDRTADLN